MRTITVIPAKIRTDKRVAIYCRVSTHKDSQEESLETQKARLQQIVKETLGWTLYRVMRTKIQERICLGQAFEV